MPTVITTNSVSGITSLTSSSSNAITFYNSSGTQTIGDVNVSSVNGGPLSGARNRIINGDIRFDQRNAGAAQANSTYGVDRWFQEWSSTAVTLQFQQVTDAPTGFTNSLKVTVQTGNASFTNSASIYQAIEGYNFSDLAFGTASAKTVTVSFWVKSSLNGSFGGVLRSNDFSQVYPFSYTINSTNTWEYKTITIPGSTTGTGWTTDNTACAVLNFGLGSVAGRTATANVWAATIARQPTGSVNLIATTGATWQVTGVQLEAGTVATPFERRSYGQELALCQRYFWSSCNDVFQFGNVRMITSTNFGGSVPVSVSFPVRMIKSPILTFYTSSARANSGNIQVNGSSVVAATSISNSSNPSGFVHWNASALTNPGDYYTFYVDANAEL